MRPSPYPFRAGVRPRPTPVYDLLTPGDLIAAQQHWRLAPAGLALAAGERAYPAADLGREPPVVAWSAAAGVMIVGDPPAVDVDDDAPDASDLRPFSGWPTATLWERLASLACTPPLTPREVLVAILVGAVIVSSGLCQ